MQPSSTGTEKPMRFLFATTGGAGHFGPLIPLAHAATAFGHEVRVAAPTAVGQPPLRGRGRRQPRRFALRSSTEWPKPEARPLPRKERRGSPLGTSGPPQWADRHLVVKLLLNDSLLYAPELSFCACVISCEG